MHNVNRCSASTDDAAVVTDIPLTGAGTAGSPLTVVPAGPMEMFFGEDNLRPVTPLALRRENGAPATDLRTLSKQIVPAINEVFDRSSPHYSEDEQATGVRWVNGRPILQKTIDCGALPNATTKNVLHEIDDLEFVVDAVGIAHNPTTSMWLPLPYTDIGVSVNATQVSIVAATNRIAYTQAWVTLRYTKTPPEPEPEPEP